MCTNSTPLVLGRVHNGLVPSDNPFSDVIVGISKVFFWGGEREIYCKILPVSTRATVRITTCFQC